jgi:putative DNA primase/helicase
MERIDILEQAKAELRPWSTEDGRLFLDYDDNSVRRTLNVAPSGQCSFRGWFTTFCVDKMGTVPSSDFLSSAQGYFAHWASTGGNKMKDYNRIGGTVDELLIDIGDDTNDCWRITRDGIERKVGGPISRGRFLRGSGTLPLVEPDFTTTPADFNKLFREFFGTDDDTTLLLMGWLIGCLRPEGPYPVLTISGEQGSGKSTILRTLRRIFDPHALDMRTPPEDFRDLQAMVRNSFVLAFDNVSYISNKMSDALCVISTGTGAQGGRALYTNAEESAVRVCRPIAMNGIPDVIERGDLVDRSIHVHLPRIDPKARRDDYEFWQTFNKLFPKLLGGLLNTALACVRGYKDVILEEKPRMSAFAVWVVAAEKELGWTPGRFINVYANNRKNAELQLLEFNGMASSLLRLMDTRQEFSGTYPELIGELETHLGPRETLPKSSHAFAAELRRIRPALERQGLVFKDGKRSTQLGQKGRSRIQIVRTDGGTEREQCD